MSANVRGFQYPEMMVMVARGFGVQGVYNIGRKYDTSTILTTCLSCTFASQPKVVCFLALLLWFIGISLNILMTQEPSTGKSLPLNLLLYLRIFQTLRSRRTD